MTAGFVSATSKRTAFGALWLGAVLLLAGCATRLPTYPEMPVSEALDVIAERDAQVTSLRGRVKVKLTDEQGRLISLDGALAVRDDGFARLQLGKFGRNAFDLTRRPDGLWVWVDKDAVPTPDTRSDAPGMVRGPQQRDLEGLADLLTWFVRRPDLRDGLLSADRHTRGTPWGRSASWSIKTDDYIAGVGVKRLVLTSLSHVSAGADWHVNLLYDIDPETGLVYCESLMVRSKAMQDNEGFVDLRLDNPELNAEIADAVFTPPRRAERVGG